MSNAPTEPSGISPPPHTVETSGEYGTVQWSVCKRLWDTLPRNEREKVLDMAGRRVIAPFFRDTTARLLRQVGCQQEPSSLSSDWSLQTLDLGCEYGTVVWLISQGLWDALPEDQRGNLLKLTEDIIHLFFHEGVANPLTIYAVRKLTG